MAVVSMSDREFSRLKVLLDVQSGGLRVQDAAELTGLSRRQVFRLLKSLREQGAPSLVSRRRGRPSNRRLPPSYRDLAMALVKERYADFGPTLATEKLSELHGFGISRETLRHWMIEDGLWIDRRRRLPSVHQPRNRRECVGELVQIDGSDHAWFEERRPRCTLLAFIDDATSRLMALRFVAAETTFDYFRATRSYLENWGKPIAFYSDKFSVFRVYKRDAVGGDGMTQFGRALHALDIDIICANSPQAKGRIERAFGTLQDRLVKELRLAGIDTIEAANAWLPGFMEDHNRRFAKPPKSDADLHRPLALDDNLAEIFATRDERSVTSNLTVHYDRMMLILEPTPQARRLARKRIMVVNYPDGRFALQYRGSDLPFRVFDKIRTLEQAPIVENKRLGPALALIKERQAALPAHQRRLDPARYTHRNNLEAPSFAAT
ncbi:ISNCY family transposase [Acidisoma cellulosilytica]|uniref:ISNCY family transposase n=1 Tax=Acidisoma cellulosilyticum TaxID=2802395 RepID=A0A963Z275_9PROT|nr:ISNCY family transposase [Acidisoma cellulosilyticum]